MLSQHERQALAEIEQQLRASEPDLAERFEHWHGGGTGLASGLRRGRGLRHLTGTLGLVLGLILFVAAFALQSADVALLAAGLVLTDVVLFGWGTAAWLRHRRRHALAGGHGLGRGHGVDGRPGAQGGRDHA